MIIYDDVLNTGHVSLEQVVGPGGELRSNMHLEYFYSAVLLFPVGMEAPVADKEEGTPRMSNSVSTVTGHTGF